MGYVTALPAYTILELLIDTQQYQKVILLFHQAQDDFAPEWAQC